MLGKNVCNRTLMGVNLCRSLRSTERKPVKTSTGPARGKSNRRVVSVRSVHHSMISSVC
jgi:hypothetical protein